MSSFSKKFITLFVLASFILVASLGFIVMAHMADGSMLDDCPASAGTSSSLCSLGTLEMVIYHISAYHSFLSAPANYGVIAFILSLALFILAGLFVYLRSVVAFVLERSSFYNFSLSTSPSVDGKNISWLSLLEHSPSQ